MKTFKQFLYEASIAQRIKMRAGELIKKYHKVDPEKVEVYKDLIKRTNERTKPIFPDDYHISGRYSARRDKHLYPSSRMPTHHPVEDNPSTMTKNPKKLRKQRAIGEIT
jgi:hypothetical protein